MSNAKKIREIKELAHVGINYRGSNCMIYLGSDGTFYQGSSPKPISKLAILDAIEKMQDALGEISRIACNIKIDD